MYLKKTVIILFLFLIFIPIGCNRLQGDISGIDQEPLPQLGEMQVGDLITCRSVSDIDYFPVSITSIFEKDIEEIFCTVFIINAKSDTKLRFVWNYNGGSKQELSSIDLIMPEGTRHAYSSLPRPGETWPVGPYLIELYVNDKLTRETLFEIQ